MATQQPAVAMDTAVRYWPEARNLADGHGSSRHLSPPYAAEPADQPGYPALLAGVLLAGGGVHAAIAIQVAVDLGLVLLVWTLAGAVGLRGGLRW
ncbi:MAG TPA: hypothetical protein VGQ33_08095, partial [Vicinamibacteria bacterium]|nr:hypothetical protein [Vicinamibacteria bacterium]